MNFREGKFMHFELNFTEVGISLFKWQQSGVGSVRGLAPSRQEATIWTYLERSRLRKKELQSI